MDCVLCILLWILRVHWILFLLLIIRFYLALATLYLALMILWGVLHYHSSWWHIKNYIIFFLDLVLGLINGEALRGLWSILLVFWYCSYFISLCLCFISHSLLLWTKDSLLGWCPSFDFGYAWTLSLWFYWYLLKFRGFIWCFEEDLAIVHELWASLF